MTDEQTAAAIVADPMNSVSETAMEAAIVRALQQARKAPAGHIIDDQGVVRRVLGTLPVTADGCVCGFPPGFGGVWHNGGGLTEQANPMRMCYEPESRLIVVWCHGLQDTPIGSCYSTREAAEAAKEAKK